MKKGLLAALGLLSAGVLAHAQSSFTPGNLVVLQTNTALNKTSSAIMLKEFTTSGTPGMSVTLPNTGLTPLQTSGVYGGSEGFLTTSTDNKFLVVAGYQTTDSVTDITATPDSTTTRAIGMVYPSGFYMPFDTSKVFYSGNDIRGGVSDGTNFWAAGASSAQVDGIDYFGPGAHAALGTGATPPKAYGIRIFNGNLYYSTQKSGPSNSGSHLGIFQLGSGLPTSGTQTVSQIINTGSATPEDFSINPAGNVAYVAIASNDAVGGIQKWTTTNGTTWTLAYTLGTGVSHIGAYGVVVDYSGTYPIVYATTYEMTGNRVISITDSNSSATATTLVAAVANVFNKGITFAPDNTGTPVVNLTTSTDTGSETMQSVITVTAHTTLPVATAQTVNIHVSGTGITAGDYTLSDTTITIPADSTSASVTFTVVDDTLGEGTEIATLAMMNPSSGMTLGTHTTQDITIFDNDGNNPPYISFNVDSTTNFIDGGDTTAPTSPFPMSGVIADPTDPGAMLGVTFNVGDAETADSALVVTVSSSDTTVVPAANLILSGANGIRNLRIVPAGVGYTTITLTVMDDSSVARSYMINYAASANSAVPDSTYWPTGMSDASDAIALDDNYFVTGDDELNVINVYNRKASGLPLVSYNYTPYLNLPIPSKPEADIECATRSTTHANRVYFMGSMSNGKAPFDNEPNRDRIFATDITGTGAATSFSFAGYAALKSAILTWGDNNGYNFTASAAAGVDSKSDTGFAAEGMVFGPDSTTLYVGLRAPLVPTANRTKAVIVPVQNFETWFNGGTQTGTPTLGAPIELNLGGRGIRDIIRMTNGTYVILAGSVDGNVNGAIYKWSGLAADTAILVAAPAGDTLNMEGVMQINVNGQPSTTALQIITDKGDDIYYGDGTEAKDFNDLIYRKFRNDIIATGDLKLPPVSVPVIMAMATGVNVYPNPTNGAISIHFNDKAYELYTVTVTDMKGAVVAEYAGTTAVGANELNYNFGTLAKGTYLLHLSSASINYSEKIVLK